MTQISTGDPPISQFVPADGSSLFGQLLLSVSGERHRRAFLDWLDLNLELQLADLEDLLSALPDEQRVPLEARLCSGYYADLVPNDAPRAERSLFLTDMETILTLRQLC